MTVLVIAGALPATYWCNFAAMALSNGLGSLMTAGSVIGAVFSVLGLAGVYGTIAIWRISLGFESPAAYIGLLFGIVALVGAVVLLSPNRWWLALLHPLAILPLVCAVYLLADVYVRTRRFRSREAAAASRS